jgi:hypothetical protein
VKARKDRDATFAYQNARRVKDSVHNYSPDMASRDRLPSMAERAPSTFRWFRLMSCCAVVKTGKSRRT